MLRRFFSLMATIGACVAGAAGCNSQPLAHVHPAVEVFADGGLDFGTEPVLNTKTLDVEVESVGQAPLHLSDVLVLDYIDGAPAMGQSAAFTITNTPPTTLAAGASGKIAVTFTPSAEQSFGATLYFETDDPDHPQVEVPLRGIGSTKAVIFVDAAAHPGQQSLDFGRVGEGQVALAGLVVHSEGTADLIIQSMALSGDPAISFQSSSRTPVTVPAGTTLPLEMEFAPPEGSPTPTSATLTIQSTDPAHPMLQVPITAEVNRAPIAVIADPGPVAPGQTVTLDGSGSYDPDGDNPITFTTADGQPGWVLLTTPINSMAAFSPSGSVAEPQVTFDLPGEYQVQLTVTDSTGLQTLHPALVTVTAKSAQALEVDLVWDNSDTDMDLHFLPDGQMFDGPYDCWAENKTPDYGPLGDASSPVLDRDALVGDGPEILTWDSPASGTYDIEANLYSTHASTTPQTLSTIRVLEYGQIVSEVTGPALTMSGQTWFAAKLDWPSGAVTSVGTVQ